MRLVTLDAVAIEDGAEAMGVFLAARRLTLVTNRANPTGFDFRNAGRLFVGADRTGDKGALMSFNSKSRARSVSLRKASTNSRPAGESGNCAK